MSYNLQQTIREAQMDQQRNSEEIAQQIRERERQPTSEGSYNRRHDREMEAQRRFRERQQDPDLFEPMPSQLSPARQAGRQNYNQLTQPGGRKRKRITKRNRRTKRNHKRSRKSKRRY
jgi:hypothetical protein